METFPVSSRNSLPLEALRHHIVTTKSIAQHSHFVGVSLFCLLLTYKHCGIHFYSFLQISLIIGHTTFFSLTILCSDFTVLALFMCVLLFVHTHQEYNREPSHFLLILENPVLTQS